MSSPRSSSSSTTVPPLITIHDSISSSINTYPSQSSISLGHGSPSVDDSSSSSSYTCDQIKRLLRQQ
jgi:hypothetical protein